MSAPASVNGASPQSGKPVAPKSPSKLGSAPAAATTSVLGVQAPPKNKVAYRIPGHTQVQTKLFATKANPKPKTAPPPPPAPPSSDEEDDEEDDDEGATVATAPARPVSRVAQKAPPTRTVPKQPQPEEDSELSSDSDSGVEDEDTAPILGHQQPPKAARAKQSAKQPALVKPRQPAVVAAPPPPKKAVAVATKPRVPAPTPPKTATPAPAPKKQATKPNPPPPPAAPRPAASVHNSGTKPTKAAASPALPAAKKKKTKKLPQQQPLSAPKAPVATTPQKPAAAPATNPQGVLSPKKKRKRPKANPAAPAAAAGGLPKDLVAKLRAADTQRGPDITNVQQELEEAAREEHNNKAWAETGDSGSDDAGDQSDQPLPVGHKASATETDAVLKPRQPTSRPPATLQSAHKKKKKSKSADSSGADGPTPSATKRSSKPKLRFLSTEKSSLGTYFWDQLADTDASGSEMKLPRAMIEAQQALSVTAEQGGLGLPLEMFRKVLLEHEFPEADFLVVQGARGPLRLEADGVPCGAVPGRLELPVVVVKRATEDSPGEYGRLIPSRNKHPVPLTTNRLRRSAKGRIPGGSAAAVLDSCSGGFLSLAMVVRTAFGPDGCELDPPLDPHPKNWDIVRFAIFTSIGWRMVDVDVVRAAYPLFAHFFWPLRRKVRTLHNMWWSDGDGETQLPFACGFIFPPDFWSYLCKFKERPPLPGAATAAATSPLRGTKRPAAASTATTAETDEQRRARKKQKRQQKREAAAQKSTATPEPTTPGTKSPHKRTKPSPKPAATPAAPSVVQSKTLPLVAELKQKFKDTDFSQPSAVRALWSQLLGLLGQGALDDAGGSALVRQLQTELASKVAELAKSKALCGRQATAIGRLQTEVRETTARLVGVTAQLESLQQQSPAGHLAATQPQATKKKKQPPPTGVAARLEDPEEERVRQEEQDEGYHQDDDSVSTEDPTKDGMEYGEDPEDRNYTAGVDETKPAFRYRNTDRQQRKVELSTKQLGLRMRKEAKKRRRKNKPVSARAIARFVETEAAGSGSEGEDGSELDQDLDGFIAPEGEIEYMSTDEEEEVGVKPVKRRKRLRKEQPEEDDEDDSDEDYSLERDDGQGEEDDEEEDSEEGDEPVFQGDKENQLPLQPTVQSRVAFDGWD